MQKFESVQTMWILIIGLVLLGIIALIAGYIRNNRLKKENRKRRTGSHAGSERSRCRMLRTTRSVRKGQPAGCCQQKIEYYDDEELDLFIGKEADAYTEEETNQFRDVLYTMQDIDVAGWVRSLQASRH